MKRNRIIVTGGCGYIGSHTVIQLISRGYEVVSIDNLSRASSESINRIERVTGIRIKNYEVDLTNLQLVNQLFDEIDEIEGIINFAAYKSVPESVKFPTLYYTNNIFSLCNVLSNCIRRKIKKIVYSSSCSIYGDIKKLPVCEETELSESKSPYASTKIMGERMLRDACISHDIRALALRYFNPVGAHSSGKIGETPFRKPDNLVPIITQTAIGKRECLEVYGGNLKTIDGSCVRDYVHVMDIADAHVLALEYMSDMQVDFDVINLGSGKGVSVFEAINAFESISGIKLKYKIGPPREGDVVEIYSDVSKAKKMLGWIPKYDIAQMMSSAWAWEQELSRQAQVESTVNSLRLP
jgi:UDP-glucose 4-epimerase